MRLLFDKAERGGKDVLQLTHLLTSMAAAGADPSDPYGRYQPVSALLIRQAMSPYVPHWMKVRCAYERRHGSKKHFLVHPVLPGGLLPHASATVTPEVCLQKHLKTCTDCQGRAGLGATGFATYPVREKEEPRRLLPEKETNETPLGQQTTEPDRGAPTLLVAPARSPE